MVDPNVLVKTALSRGELDRLLLGDRRYHYLPQGSPAPGSTDLPFLVGRLYHLASRDQAIRGQVLQAVEKIVSLYEGLEPVSMLILFEADRNSRGQQSFQLPLDELAARLRVAIQTHIHRLKMDKSGFGAGRPDGMLGELRFVCKRAVQLGGPSFCD